jgi:hypothetical protein
MFDAYVLHAGVDMPEVAKSNVEKIHNMAISAVACAGRPERQGLQ